MNNYIRDNFYKNLVRIYCNIAPVFSYLLVLIAGFLLSEIIDLGQGFKYLLLSLGFAFLILSFQFNKKIFSLLFFFCFSLLYYDYRIEENAELLPAIDTSLEVEITALQTTNSRYKSGYAKILQAYDFNAELLHKEVFFVIYGNADLDIGSKFNLQASLTPVVDEAESFDAFLARQKISYKLIANSDSLEALPLGYFTKSVQNIRAYILDNIENSEGKYERYLPMYRALMIGDMSKVAKADKQIFARSASIHIFAISGLHVGLVASLLFMLFRTLGVRHIFSIIITLALLYVYVQVCGAKPSAMRAYVMLCFVGLAYLLRRKSNTFNALLMSALFALLYDPKILFNVGFLLSYCVVASIVLFGLSLYEYISKIYKPYAMIPDKLLSLPQHLFKRFYYYLAMSFCVSFSAFLGGSLLCSHFFGYIAWSSVINFIIFVPLVSLILVLGFFSLILPSFLSKFINDFVLMLLEFMTSIASFFAKSIFVIDVRIQSPYVLVFALFIFFAILIYLKDKRDLRLIYAPAFSLILVICYWLKI